MLDQAEEHVGNEEAVVEEAQRVLEGAEAELRAAAGQQQEVRSQIRALTEQIAMADDVDGIAALAAERAAVQARLEAYTARIESRQAALAEAQERLRSRELERDKVLLEMKKTEAKGLDEQFREVISTFVKTAVDHAQRLGAVVREANALNRGIKQAEGVRATPIPPASDPASIRHGNGVTFVLERVEELWSKAEAEIRSEKGAG